MKYIIASFLILASLSCAARFSHTGMGIGNTGQNKPDPGQNPTPDPGVDPTPNPTPSPNPTPTPTPTPNPNPTPNPQPNPGRGAWPSGYLQMHCHFDEAQQHFDLGRAGMLDRGGDSFLPENYKWEKWADEGWITAKITFPGFDATQKPLPKPETVSVEYYLFWRPDWRVPENFWEIRRTATVPFEAGQQIRVGWWFTKFMLTCDVEKPPVTTQIPNFK